jgi:hypothetical protein
MTCHCGVSVLQLITFYLLVFLAAIARGLAFFFIQSPPPYLEAVHIPLTCCLLGGAGGCIYCLRAVYLNKCVRKSWDKEWHVWYFLRPILSTCCGGISFLFLKAGLLVLESGTKDNATEIGFYALAFVAGLNVDKFLGKIEQVAQAVWGIERSRSSSVSSTIPTNTEGKDGS